MISTTKSKKAAPSLIFKASRRSAYSRPTTLLCSKCHRMGRDGSSMSQSCEAPAMRLTRTPASLRSE
jgi:hypothetical protein